MTKSMTGCGQANICIDDLEFQIDIHSVNKRNLEIFLSIPREWQKLERPFQEQIRKYIARGKISASLKVNNTNHSDTFSWNPDALKSTLDQLQSFSENHGYPFKANTELIFSIAKTLQQSEELPTLEADAETILIECLNKALSALIDMRDMEGASLAKDIKARLKLFEANVSQIETLSEGFTDHYRERLLERLENSGLEVDISDERVLKEIAIFADKCDISEELTRLKSHSNQFCSMLEAKEAVGRKMDFLCQEINRELNTIGSKTNLIEVTRLIIELKNELERIREQVQNIE